MTPDFDLDDEQLRRTRSVKWTYGGPGVLPAWVAEIDVAVCPPVAAALHRAIDDGVLGYPAVNRDSGLPEATVEFLATRFGWTVDPGRVLATGDVMSGVILALVTICDPAPVVVPVPTYPPFLAAVGLTGREIVPVPMLAPAPGAGVDGPGWTLDLERIEGALAAGARTVLLANPHNPTGRSFSRSELEGLRDVVLRHGARVVSDEIHAPLVLPGAVHTPYAALDGTAGHITTLIAASKAWNLPGLKCAQLIASSTADAAALAGVPPVANHGTSPLGVVATITAYTEGLDWLDGLVTALDARRTQLSELLATHLPNLPDLLRQPSEATYLAWLDARGTALADPAAEALSRAKVMVNPGSMFGPIGTGPAGAGPTGAGRYDGFVRLNYATSAERLERVVKALADAWG